MTKRWLTTGLLALALLLPWSSAPELIAEEPGSAPTQRSLSCEEPITRLTTLPADRVEDRLGTPIREVLDNVWRGYNGHPDREPRCAVELGGKVLIGPDAHDFTLIVRQEDGVQSYRLAILDYGLLQLEVSVAPDAHEARFTLAREDGERTKGILDLRPEAPATPPG